MRDNVPPMLVRPRSLALAILATGLALPTAAHANDVCQAAPLVSTCINADNLWPHAGAARFVGVGGTELVDPGRLGFGIVADYLSRPVVFRIPSPAGSGSDQYAIDNQVNGNFLWSYGVTRRLELDLGVPITFGQTGVGAEPITGSGQHLQETAVRDLRFGAAYALVPRQPADTVRVWSLTARFEVSAPTGDRTQFAGDRAGVFSPSVSADYRRGRWFAGIEIGARIRPADQLLGADVGTQGVVGIGIGYDILKRYELLSVMLEARTLPTFATQYVAAQSTNEDHRVVDVVLPRSHRVDALRTHRSARHRLVRRHRRRRRRHPAHERGGDRAAVPVRRRRPLRAERRGPRPRSGSRPRHARPVPRRPRPAATGCPEGMTPMPRLDLMHASDKCKGDPTRSTASRPTTAVRTRTRTKTESPTATTSARSSPSNLAGLPDGCPRGQAPTAAPSKK